MKEQTVTIQATAKRFKAATFLGAMGFCVSFPMILVAHNAGDPTAKAWILLLVSLAVLLYGKVGKWWNHE